MGSILAEVGSFGPSALQSASSHWCMMAADMQCWGMNQGQCFCWLLPSRHSCSWTASALKSSPTWSAHLKEHTRDVFWLYLYKECIGTGGAQKHCFAYVSAASPCLRLMLTCHCTSMSPESIRYPCLNITPCLKLKPQEPITIGLVNLHMSIVDVM